MFKQKVEKNYEIIIPSFYPFPFSIFILTAFSNLSYKYSSHLLLIELNTYNS